MNVVPFPEAGQDTESERQEFMHSVEQISTMWLSAMRNLEYTLACLSDVRTDVEYAAAYQLIEEALAELKSTNLKGLSDDECRTVLYRRLLRCDDLICQSFQLIRTISVT